jgi:hypothetical protein
MSSPGKRSFTSFVKPATAPTPVSAPAQATQTFHADPTFTRAPLLTEPARMSLASGDQIATGEAPAARPEVPVETGMGTSERTRVVTGTGRVRTYTASRNLPGVTLRLTEDRWERLKMLSIQERRPIQEILGEALDGYMRGRGLRW